MQFSVNRDTLLAPLQIAFSVSAKKPTMAILSNVLLDIDTEKNVTLRATDLEVQTQSRIQANDCSEPGRITVPARKLIDICRNLPEGAELKFKLEQNNQLCITSAKSRFLLSTLSAENFPELAQSTGLFETQLSENALQEIFKKTYFAMAQQDIRYFLNGLLLEFDSTSIKGVATDGHRLAYKEFEGDFAIEATHRAILPRKAAIEMMRLLSDQDQPVGIALGESHIRFTTSSCEFSSKLISGSYPRYQDVIPKDLTLSLTADAQSLRTALNRASVLSNEQYRGVRLNIQNNQLSLCANNPEQESSQDELLVDYQGPDLELGFNVSYLLDILSAVDSGDITVSLKGPKSSALIQQPQDPSSLFVLMPINL